MKLDSNNFNETLRAMLCKLFETCSRHAVEFRTKLNVGNVYTRYFVGVSITIFAFAQDQSYFSRQRLQMCVSSSAKCFSRKIKNK